MCSKIALISGGCGDISENSLFVVFHLRCSKHQICKIKSSKSVGTKTFFLFFWGVVYFAILYYILTTTIITRTASFSHTHVNVLNEILVELCNPKKYRSILGFYLFILFSVLFELVKTELNEWYTRINIHNQEYRSVKFMNENEFHS